MTNYTHIKVKTTVMTVSVENVLKRGSLSVKVPQVVNRRMSILRHERECEHVVVVIDLAASESANTIYLPVNITHKPMLSCDRR